MFSKLTFFLCFDSIFCNCYNFLPLWIWLLRLPCCHIFIFSYSKEYPHLVLNIYIYIYYIYIYIYIYIYVNLKGIARISANTSKMEKLIETVSDWESLMLHSSPLTHLQGLSLCNLHCALHFLTRKPLHFSSHYPHLLFQNIEGNTCLIQNHLAATGFVFFAVFWIAVSQVLKRQCFW